MSEIAIKKLIKSKSGLRMVTRNEDHKSPFCIQEPPWVPDREAPNCINCSVKFGFTTRKHHCRRCGLIFCGNCCDSKLELPRMCFVDPVRVCVNCETQTRTENAFFQQDVKFLISGAIFSLRLPHSENQLIHCKLSPDHRFLVLDGSDVRPLELSHITRLGVSFDDDDRNTLSICYSPDKGEGENAVLELDTAKDDVDRKTGINWIKAFLKANNLMEKPIPDEQY